MKSWLSGKEAAKYLGMTLKEFKKRGPTATGKTGAGNKRWSERNLALWKARFQ